MYDRDYYNIVKQLYSNLKRKVKKIVVYELASTYFMNGDTLLFSRASVKLLLFLFQILQLKCPIVKVRGKFDS